MTDQSIHAVPDNLKPLRSDADRVRPLVREKPQEPELRSFLHVVYRALMMVTRYLEKTYNF